jgi:hypothetical protein
MPRLYQARFETLSSIEAVRCFTLPHRLGKAEALLAGEFQQCPLTRGSLFVFKNQWSGDHLDFRANLLGQSTSGLSMSPRTTSGLGCNSPGYSRSWPTRQRPWGPPPPPRFVTFW